VGRKIQINFFNSIPAQKRGPHHIQKKDGGFLDIFKN
jgi:hypothetical protein